MMNEHICLKLCSNYSVLYWNKYFLHHYLIELKYKLANTFFSWVSYY